jgi:hypothetical protein
MDVGAILGTFLTGAVPALLGVVVGYVLESRRRAEDRRQQRIEREQEAVTALQYGLVGVLDGIKMSRSVWFQEELKAKVAGRSGGIAAFLDAVPEVSDSAWYRDWVSSNRQLGIMVTRTTDPELKRLTIEALQLLEELQDLPYDQFTKRFPELLSAVADANERAGQHYLELDLDCRPGKIKSRSTSKASRSFFRFAS